ncbi:MAG: carbon monoxide dehydrogenase [Planctomycetota bacterium]|nr:MAG: carbon monoxide dehydrogenase [Planctomycetota bacterium]
MRAALSELEVQDPTSLRHALEILSEKPDCVPLAGCTDLMVMLNAGQPPGRNFLNLGGLKPLRGIELRDDVLRIGALTTFREIRESEFCQRHFPMLVMAAAEIGGPQIQNRGTLGGNVINASPAGDSLPILAVCEAVLLLRSLEQTRRVSFLDFYTGYRTSLRRPEELLIAIELPLLQGRQWFRKIGTRAAQAISKVVMAGLHQGESIRLAAGSVAPTVIRLSRTERAWEEGAPREILHQALQSDIQPIDDLRSTAAYRRAVSANLLQAFLRLGEVPS